jgi:predicted MFS family arabinose efflux permease
VLASSSVPLAQRYGRYVLFGGGLLIVAGVAAVRFGAEHVATATNPWPVVPGLALAGAGLSLLIIPLVNVVLTAVPSQAAGAASGLFSTAQQLGGALGVALAGTVFFGQLGQHTFTSAFTGTMPVVAALFLGAALLSLVLPKTAVADEHA